MPKNITQDELKRWLNYDHLSGVFTWRVKCPWACVGDVAGYVDRLGYRRIKLHGDHYPAHRLAWLYMHGKWPNVQIDHIDGNPSNNCIANLRDVTTSENQHNQRNARGYYFCKVRKKWNARIRVANIKQQIHLGSFFTESEARAAYIEAKKVYHPTSPIIA